MINPSINSLMKKTNNRFMLCVIAGKRARQLADGAIPLTSVKAYSNVTVAVNEINEDKIHYTEAVAPVKNRVKNK